MSAALLKLVRSWQRSIDSVWSNPAKELSDSSSDQRIHRLILTIVWIVLCEQRQIPVKLSLRDLQQGDRTYQRLLELTEAFKSCLGISNHVLLAGDDRVHGSPEFDRLLQSLIGSLYDLDCVRISTLSCETLGQLYEQLLGDQDSKSSSADRFNSISSLAAKFKKNNGVYYTPAAIVHSIIQQTVSVVLPQTPTIRILDPACGSGAFLLAAYQTVLDWQLQQAIESHSLTVSTPETLQQGQDGQWKLTQTARAKILIDHIYGVDLDPIAVQVTQLSLGLKCLEDLPIWEGRSLPDLNHTIRCGNALIDIKNAAEPNAAEPNAAEPNAARFPISDSDSFNWQQAFPAVFHAGGFDVVIGNPPYIDSETMMQHLPTWRHYCNQHYRTAKGNW
ncbi:MAG TPA: DNA methyltransferase, partial [Allocoleopsis sp.]